jgi:adenylosuccinate synthase
MQGGVLTRMRNFFLRSLEAARRTLKDMRVLTVVGLQWGDEGKGKLMDFLAHIYDWAVRYSGGSNAGHTIYDQTGEKFVTHLLPASALHGKPAVCGRDEFFNAEKFREERDTLEKQTGQTLSIIIDRAAPLWTLWHPPIEDYLKYCKGDCPIGTTNQGIVAFAILQSMRMHVRVDDCLRSYDQILEILRPIELVVTPWFRQMQEMDKQEGKAARVFPNVKDVAREIMSHGELLEPYIADTSTELHNAIKDGAKILLEGAQGTGLDNVWGTTPYTSLGKSTAGAAASCSGLAAGMVNGSIGVFKPIVTRVGEGPFMSEIGKRADAEKFPKLCPGLFVNGKETGRFSGGDTGKDQRRVRIRSGNRVSTFRLRATKWARLQSAAAALATSTWLG